METHSPGYDVKTTGYRVGTTTFQIRTLLDQRQFSDPDGSAERAGISATSWPNFGTVWPAGLALAEEMSRFPVEGKSILEVGCGIGLPSLVLQQRGATITATDYLTAQHRPECTRADPFFQSGVDGAASR
jgi:2-polyprenyl-3-methyl-5-hydroxy-6-metoxy-1,4-benzoquinol methylase